MKETEEGNKLTDSNRDKAMGENPELLDQLQASKRPWKGFLPPRHNEAIFRIFCFGSLGFVSNLAFFVTNSNETLAAA